MTVLSVHDYHPPDDVRVFRVPHAAVRRWDATAFVYDLLYDDVVLRHYSFAAHWFVVNCTLDLQGGFVVDPGPFGYTFNCDIATPVLSVGTDLYSVDLFVDVLVGPDGRTHRVKDEDEFAQACTQDWLTAEEQRVARNGLASLLRLVEGEGLVTFLDDVLPFGDVRPLVPPPMTRLRFIEVPLLAPDARSSLYGIDFSS